VNAALEAVGLQAGMESALSCRLMTPRFAGRVSLFLLIGTALVGCPPVTDDTGLPDPATRPDDTDPIPTSPLVVVGYNVESGDASSDTVSDYVSQVQGEHLWGFSEVLNQSWLVAFAEAAADDGSQDFDFLMGTTGNSDRLGFVWDRNALELLDWEELHDINVGGTARAPLVGRFRLLANDTELLVVVNHLWRTNASARHEQAELLNAWGAAQTLPIVATGDYNFDWAVEGGEEDHDLGYDLMTQNSVWEWVRPDELIATQCSFAFEGVLDFTFVSGEAKNWAATSEILFPQNVTCQESSERPDHRPVRADLAVPDP
jgi:hypothetical protein